MQSSQAPQKKLSLSHQKSSRCSVALVCDWLTTPGGAEKVLLELHRMYPDAPIYTSQYRAKGIDWFNDATVKTGWLNLFPAKLRKLLGPLRQLYFSHLDLSQYDLIISVTGAEAKSVKFSPSATHLCYCHVPTQYYWQFYDQYLAHPGFGIFDPLVRGILKLLITPLRKADLAAAARPTKFITISNYDAAEIKKTYHRDAVVIPPPVDVKRFSASKSPSLRKFSTKISDFSTSFPQPTLHHCLPPSYLETRRSRHFRLSIRQSTPPGRR